MQPEQLGPYTIVRTIGRGGMGAVYEGVHQQTQEHMAIKVLSPAYSDDPGFRERFQLEIEALKKLDHPHIVKLTGYGEQSGRLFYTMELVDGPSLQELLAGGKRFTWREVAEYTIQICSALKHAHDHGIVHRDLKPANLVLTANNAIKLTDFGIAKVFGAAQQTAIGGVIGTADYMSPEQARGLPISPRSDLFSLGTVMYALLSGGPPFKASSRTGVLLKLIKQPHRSLRETVPETPPELSDLVDRLMEKDSERRIPTAVSLGKQLRALRHGLDSRSAPSTPSDPPEDEDFEVNQEEVTLTPAGPPAAEGSHYWRETVVADANVSATVANAGPTHFTSMPSDARVKRDWLTQGPREEFRGQWLTTLGLAAALLSVVGLAWYASRPPSASKLYAKISIVAAEGNEARLIDVKNAMRQFVDLYPDDDRAPQVLSWMRDHDCYLLWRKIEREARKRGGPEYLDNAPRRYLECSRLTQKDPAAATQGFGELVASLEAQPISSDEIQEILESARHRAQHPSQ